MSRKQKYGDSIGPDFLAQLRQEIAAQTAHISPKTLFQVGKLMELVEGLGYRGYTDHQIQHLRRACLIQPEVDNSGNRKIYWYDLTDLQDTCLILTLTKKHRIPLTKVGGLLWAEARQQQKERLKLAQQASVDVPHNQMKRAQYHLRGRLLEILLAWLFGEQPLQHAIISLRQQPHRHRNEARPTSKVILNDVEWLRVDKLLGEHPDDLTFKVSREGEILHHTEDPVGWQRFRHYRWFYLIFTGDLPPADYHMVIGVPPNLDAQLDPEALTPEVIETLPSLLHLCFLPKWEDGVNEADTPLQGLANLIPNIAADWQYCIIFVPEKVGAEETLRVLTHSLQAPRSVNWGNVLLSPGQLLSGWTYQMGEVCVVQRSIGEADPRIAYQDEEGDIACIAVPTLVNEHINGVIYVGTKTLGSEKHQADPFPPSQIRVLEALGAIVGEFIERQTIAQRTRQIGLNILMKQSLPCQPWDNLKSHLHKTVTNIKSSDRIPDQTSNLHIMAIRLDNYSDIQARSEKIARWVAQLIADTTGNFYATEYSVSPALFAHNASEFVIVADYLSLDDTRER